jgi:uncharacterized protein (DUF433 family)
VTATCSRCLGVLGLAAVIAGTRVPVDMLFEDLERGTTLDAFLEQFSTASRDEAVAILNAAREGMLTQAAAV